MSGTAEDGPRTRPKASEVAFEGSTDAVTSGIVRDADERTGAMSRHAHGGRGASAASGARALGTARDLAGGVSAADPDSDDGREASEDAIGGTGRTASRAARARHDASPRRDAREQATAGKGTEVSPVNIMDSGIQDFMRLPSSPGRTRGPSRSARRTPPSPLPALGHRWTRADGSGCSRTR